MISNQLLDNLKFGSPRDKSPKEDKSKLAETLEIAQKINKEFDILSVDTFVKELSKIENALKTKDTNPKNANIRNDLQDIYYRICIKLLDQHRLHGAQYFKSLSFILPISFNKLTGLHKKIIEPKQNLNDDSIKEYQYHYDLILKFIHYFPHSFLYSSPEEEKAWTLAKSLNDNIKTALLTHTKEMYQFIKRSIGEFRNKETFSLEHTLRGHREPLLKLVNLYLEKLQLLTPILLSMKGEYDQLVQSIKKQEQEFTALKEKISDEHEALTNQFTSMTNKVNTIAASIKQKKISQKEAAKQLQDLAQQSNLFLKKAYYYFNDVEYVKYSSFFRYVNNMSKEAKSADDHRARLDSIRYEQDNYYNLILYVSGMLENSKSFSKKQGCALLLTILSNHFDQLLDGLTLVPFHEESPEARLFPKKRPTKKMGHFIDEAKMTIDIALSDFKKSDSSYLMEPIDELTELRKQRTHVFFKPEAKNNTFATAIAEYSDIFNAIIEECINFVIKAPGSPEASIAKLAMELLVNYLCSNQEEHTQKMNTLSR